MRSLRVLGAAALSIGGVALGCTEYLLWDSLPDHVLSVRTIDFSYDLMPAFVKVARAIPRTSIATTCKECTAHSWVGTYGYVFVDWMNQGYASDGMNEKGLSVGSLLQKATPDYPKANKADARPVLAVQSIPHYILATCATVDEAKAALQKVQTSAADLPWDELIGQLPTHITITDRQGNTAVVEWTNNATTSPACIGNSSLPDGKMCFYGNAKHKVVVNEPSFEAQQKQVDKWYTDAGNPITWSKVFENLPGDWRGVSRLARIAALNELSKEQGGEWIVPSAENILPTVYSQFTLNFEELEALSALTSCIAATAPFSDSKQAYDAFEKELGDQLAVSDNPRPVNTTAQGMMADLLEAVGKTADQFGTYMHMVSKADVNTQKHLITFPSTFEQPYMNTDSVQRAIAISHSIALPPGSNIEAGRAGATLATLIRDHTGLSYGFTTPGSFTPSFIDLVALDYLKDGGVVPFSSNLENPFKDVSSKMSDAVVTTTEDGDPASTCPVCKKCGTTGGEIAIMVILALLAIGGTVGGAFIGYRRGIRVAQRGEVSLSAYDISQ